MKDKTNVFLIVSLMLSMMVFLGTVFAWVSMSEHARLEAIVVQVSDYDSKIDLKVSKNGGSEQIFTTQPELALFLSNSVPSDYFNFEISIQNLSSFNVSARIFFSQINSQTTNVSFDMRDVFLMIDGKIIIDDVDYPLLVNSTTPIVKFGQPLSNNRLSNVIDGQGNLAIAEALSVPKNELVVIKFGLLFQDITEDIGYQGGTLSIGALHVIFDS